MPPTAAELPPALTAMTGPPVGAGPLTLDLPIISSWDPVAFAITAVALLGMFNLKWSPLRTIGICALLGLLVYAARALT